jgi:hypothetical protein
MHDLESLRFSSASADDFLAAFSSIVDVLPPETRKRLRHIRNEYIFAYGNEGAFQRMNNRSLAQVMAEFQEPDMKPVASGERDGMRYELYDSPSLEGQRAEPAAAREPDRGETPGDVDRPKQGRSRETLWQRLKRLLLGR